MNLAIECLHELPTRVLTAGEDLLQEGLDSKNLYFLVSGSVEVLKDGVRIAEVREPGAIFGEMSLLLGSPATATVRATAETTVKVVENPQMFLPEHPDVALYVAQILARRLDALNRYLVDVKRQFGDQGDHLAMLDEVLDALMNRHPRTIARREPLDQ